MVVDVSFDREFSQAKQSFAQSPIGQLRQMADNAQQWITNDDLKNLHLIGDNEVTQTAKEHLHFQWMQLLALDKNLADTVVLQAKQEMQQTAETGRWQLDEIARNRLIYTLSVWSKYADPKKTIVPLSPLAVTMDSDIDKLSDAMPKKTGIKVSTEMMENIRLVHRIVPDLDINRALNDAMMHELFQKRRQKKSLPEIQYKGTALSPRRAHWVGGRVHQMEISKRVGYEYSDEANKVMSMARGRLDSGFPHRLAQTLMESRWHLNHNDMVHLMGCILFVLRVDKDSRGNPNKAMIFALDEYLRSNNVDITRVFLGLRADQPINADVQDILSSVYGISERFSVDDIAIEHAHQMRDADFDSSNFSEDDDAEHDADAEEDWENEPDIDEKLYELGVRSERFDDTKIQWATIGLSKRTIIPNPKLFLTDGTYVFEDGTLDDPVIAKDGYFFYFETSPTHDEDSDISTNELHTFSAEYVVTFGHLYSSFYLRHMDAQKIAEIYNMPIELVVSSLRNLTQRLDKDGFVKISKEPEQVEKPAQVIQPEIEYIGTGVADATIIPALRRDQARKPSPEVLKAMEWLRLIAAELPTSPEGESEIEEIPHGLFAGEAQMPEPERFERVNESSFEDIANAFIPVLGDIDMHQRKRRIPPMSDAPETVGMSGLLRLFIVEGETAEQISRYYKQKYKINLAPESIEPYMNYIFSELRQTEDRSRLDDSLVRQARKNRNPFAVFNRTHRLVKTIKDSYKGSTVTEDQIWDNLPQFLREVFNELRSSGIDPYSLAAFEDVTAHF